MRPIKILFIIGQLSHGGSERHVVDMATRLERTRFTPHVLCFRSGGPLAAELRQGGVALTEQQIVDWPIPFWRVYHEVGRIAPDVVCVYTYEDKLWGRLAAGLLGIPVVLAYRTWRRPWYEKMLLRYVDVVVANSTMMRDDYLSTYDFDPAKAYYLPNGVDVSQFRSGDKAEARAGLGLEQGVPLAVQIARFESVKDHETSLTAFARVLQVCPEARFVLVGHGSHGTWIRRKIGELGIGHGVTILEPMADPSVLYRAADMVVLSSASEGLPRVLVEAGASECPSLATDVGGCPEVVLNGKTGYVVPAKNPQAMAERWLALVRDPESGLRLGRAARAHVCENFSMDMMVAQFQEILVDTLRNHT